MDKQDKVTEPVDFKFSNNHQMFCYIVAEAMGCAVGELPRLSYRIMSTKGSDTTVLRTEAEYAKMIRLVKGMAEIERDRAMEERSRSSKARKKGSKSAMKAKQTQKPCEVRLFRKIIAPPNPRDGRKVCQLLHAAG